MSGTIRIMTYNTRGSLGMDGVRSTSRIAETVRLYSPDIICFQEIHQWLAWSKFENQPERLEHLLQRNFVFHPPVRFGLGNYGIGIASRWHPSKVQKYLLPSVGEQRGLLELDFRGVSGIKAFRVFCTHWGLKDEERAEQGQFCVEKVLNSPLPTLFCGDLNEEVSAKGVATLIEQGGLEDTNPQGVFTFPSDTPNVRIDYILGRGLACERFEVASSLASDHLPLIADIQIG